MSSNQGSDKLLERLWENTSKKQKEQLLQSRNLNKSWAETKTIHEMVERGGGMVARDLHQLTNLWKKKNPNTKVRF